MYVTQRISIICYALSKTVRIRSFLFDAGRHDADRGHRCSCVGLPWPRASSASQQNSRIRVLVM